MLTEDTQVEAGLSDVTRDIRVLAPWSLRNSTLPREGKVGSVATIIGRRMGILTGTNSRDLRKWLLIMGSL